MKKLIWLIGTVLVAFFVYMVALPYLTFSQIKAAALENDSEVLSEKIDFTVLKQNLKEQLIEQVTNYKMSEMKDNPIGVLAIATVSVVVDGKVESYVSPAGLASLMEGKIPGEDESAEKGEPLKNAKYGFESAIEFSVSVPDDKGEEIRFILLRDGLDWKLENIVLPGSD